MEQAILMDEELIEPKQMMDEQDVMELLERTYGLMTTVLEGRLRTSTRSDILELLKDLEDVIAWHRMH
jgi:hypothetical protein